MLAGCSGGGGAAPTRFNFRSDSPDRYVRIDRTGEPAIATALLSRGRATSRRRPTAAANRQSRRGNPFNAFNDQRDALNRGDPINDARDFAVLFTEGPQINALANYHYELGPQLRSLGRRPARPRSSSPPSGMAEVDISTCVAQIAPAVLPDVITFDLNPPTSWPNGRGYDDPVVDRLLAAALLKISRLPARRTPSTRSSASSTRPRTRPARRCRPRSRICARRTPFPDRASRPGAPRATGLIHAPPSSLPGLAAR